MLLFRQLPAGSHLPTAWPWPWKSKKFYAGDHTYTTNFKWGINLTHMPEFANVGPTQIYLKSEYPLNPPFDHHVPH